MILTFKCADTESLFQRNRVKRFANIESVARGKLNQLHAAASLDFLRVPRPPTTSKRWQATAKGNTAFVSTPNLGCALCGRLKDRRMSKSSTTTDGV